jgi:hypothetical protein
LAEPEIKKKEIYETEIQFGGMPETLLIAITSSVATGNQFAADSGKP